jgi:hypothetical protein
MIFADLSIIVSPFELLRAAQPNCSMQQHFHETQPRRLCGMAHAIANYSLVYFLYHWQGYFSVDTVHAH